MSFQLPDDKAWLAEKDLFKEHAIQREIYEDDTPIKVLVGGRRSGKSILLMIECLRVAMNVALAVCWIVCPDYSTARDVYALNICLRLSVMGVPFEYNKRSNEILILKNNVGTTAKIVFKSADTEKNIKGRDLPFFGYDEAAMINPDIWVGLLPSVLSSKTPPRIVVTSSVRVGGLGNALLKELFQKGQKDSSNYEEGYKSWKFTSYDNPHLDKKRFSLISGGMSSEQFQQEINSEFVDVGGSVYSLFDTTTHIKKLEINRNLPLCFSFDFNVRLMTTSISQMVEGNPNPYFHNNKEIKEQERVLHVLDCINEKGQIVTTQRQCNLLRNYLNELDWKNEVYIYGDAMGKSHHTSATDESSDWQIVKYNFPEAYYFVPKSNPPVQSRFNAVNTLFRNGKNEVGIFINNNESCKPLIKDFENVVRNKAGSDQDKSNAELTHNADNIGYLIHKEFPVQKRSLDFMTIQL